MQVYKVYAQYFSGLLRWWKPPAGTVFNIALFTGWEEALTKHIPAKGWQRIMLLAMIKFQKWLMPRPKLFKWLNVSLWPITSLLSATRSCRICMVRWFAVL